LITLSRLFPKQGKASARTPLLPGLSGRRLARQTLPEDAVANLGADEMSRQPAELATAYVMLADPLSSYVAGATIAVTSGKLIL
jgi:hypothetical protein